MTVAFLKVKVKSLAVEATIIRKEERVWKPRRIDGIPHPTFFGLKAHRRGVLRNESRHALLAYGFLRGKTYKQIENKAYEPPNWNSIEQLAKRFGGLDSRVLLQRFAEWKDAAISQPKK